MRYKKNGLFVAILLIVVFILSVSYQSKRAYQIFDNAKGKAIEYEKMIKGISEADVVFFGELHNSSVGHWLELQVLKSLAETRSNGVVAGAEMFESDAQLVLNEYLSDQIKEEHLLKEGKVWPNYKTDYAPLVNFAKEQSIPFIATNIPRRYASIVGREGLSGLEKVDDFGKKYIAPLPIEVDYELPSYKEMETMMGGHGGKNMVEAQAIKDATMAYFISKNLADGKVFLHFNGSYHSKHREGILWYLKKLHPDLRVSTITLVEQESLEEVAEEYCDEADYIIAVPTDMTKTY